MLALQELQPRSLGVLGLTEMNREPQMLRRIIGGAEDLLRFRSQGRHPLAAARTGAEVPQRRYDRVIAEFGAQRPNRIAPRLIPSLDDHDR